MFASQPKVIAKYVILQQFLASILDNFFNCLGYYRHKQGGRGMHKMSKQTLW